MLTLNKNLIQAALDSNEDKIKLLLSAGADVNAVDASGQTALFYAAEIGCIEIVKALVIHGANVNAKNQIGMPILYMPTLKSNLECVSYLIEHGADVNIADGFGMTPLHIAITNKWKEGIYCLVNKNADLQIKNGDDESAIDRANATNDEEIIEIFMAKVEQNHLDGVIMAKELEGDLKF